LLRTNPTESGAIPPGVRGAIRRRLQRLSPECNHVLNVACVIGREFSLTHLLRLSEFNPDTVLSAMDEAHAARLIIRMRETPDFVFVHALVRETLYDELSSVERMQWHQRVGTMLARLYGPEVEAHLAELSHHFVQAAPIGALDEAIEYTRRAAERNMRLLAY